MILLYILINIFLYFFILYYNKEVLICNVINYNQIKSKTYLYYIPHRYCGIMNQILDIANVLSLSLVLHKYFSCIIIYYYIVRYWKYVGDYFSFCFYYSSNKNDNNTIKKYSITYKMEEKDILKIYRYLIKERNYNILLTSHYSYFHLYTKKEINIFKRILVFKNVNELKIKWIIYFDRYVIKNSNRIRREIKRKIIGIKNDLIIGMHIRTGFSDFGDRVTYFGGYNNVYKFINDSINLCNYSDRKCKWIISTDNSKLYSNLVYNYSTFVYDYKKILDYPHLLQHSIQYILKPFNKYSATVLYEIEMLLNCDILILSRYSRISHFIYNSKEVCKFNKICKFIS